MRPIPSLPNHHIVQAAGTIPIILAALLTAYLPAGCSKDDSSNPAGPDDQASEYGCIAGHAPLFDDYSLYWGDLHSHTVYSDDAATQEPPPGTPADALAYAADPAGGNLDFVAITDHAETLTAEEWSAYLDTVRTASSSPALVVFPGFEYTNSSYQAGHGHKCVLLKDPEHVPATPSGANSRSDPLALWEDLDGSPGTGYYMTVPHHPAKGIDYGVNMSTDWDAAYVDGERQPLVEIYSVHGCSEVAGCEEPVEHFHDDRTVETALLQWLETGDEAYKLGIIASTDSHKSTPGAVAEVEENVAEMEGPYTGGLAAVWAAALDREALWDGLSERRTLGTTGARIAVEFTAKAGSTIVPMGGTLSISDPTDVYLHVSASGEAGVGIHQIDIIRNGALLVSAQTGHLDYRDPGVSADTYYRVKVYQNETPVVHWNHCHYERAWTSPIWIERE